MFGSDYITVAMDMRNSELVLYPCKGNSAIHTIGMLNSSFVDPAKQELADHLKLLL